MGRTRSARGRTTEAPLVGTVASAAGPRRGTRKPSGYAGRIATGGRGGLSDADLGANNRSTGRSSPNSSGFGIGSPIGAGGVGGIGGGGGVSRPGPGVVETTTPAGGSRIDGGTRTISPPPEPMVGLRTLTPVRGVTPTGGTSSLSAPTTTGAPVSSKPSAAPVVTGAKKAAAGVGAAKRPTTSTTTAKKKPTVVARPKAKARPGIGAAKKPSARRKPISVAPKKKVKSAKARTRPKLTAQQYARQYG